MNTTPRCTVATLALTLIAVTALTGCSAVSTILQKEKTGEYADVTALEDWDGNAPWVPSDATDIRTHESTDGKVAVLLLDSAADLDAALCTEVDRESAPAFSIEGAPNVFKTDRVFACGDWTVAPTKDGWYGWTPNDPDEKKQSPTA
ncbi:hypothetical protein ELQ90_00240 [Labedella phragmitis]|uniref:Lipoprotein n=1 Tax=Labedella phragmitis TaxID=2498849 RepID=A0A444PX50_9MICO|nr:hypothetical protein [Labedella phragmitis]RWZ52433.1 hypothetical protein ELQ90_00240 [Labedella phragmitis]